MSFTFSINLKYFLHLSWLLDISRVQSSSNVEWPQFEFVWLLISLRLCFWGEQEDHRNNVSLPLPNTSKDKGIIVSLLVMITSQLEWCLPDFAMVKTQFPSYNVGRYFPSMNINMLPNVHLAIIVRAFLYDLGQLWFQQGTFPTIPSTFIS